ncbi:MAG TPA: MlaD family protein [Thermodesulfobacteriota bacterium]|nr:MlaD family protein [Thermodesulfobacteriota bacterium]
MKTEVKVGIFFVLGLVILLIIFEFITEIPLFTKEYLFKTYFKSVGELKEGNPVKLSGVEVGKISKIKIADGKIEVTLKVKKGTPVKNDSLATIKLTSLLGTSYINLTFGSPESPPAEPGSILQSQEPADVSEILAKVESAVSSIESVFSDNGEKIGSILNSLDTVLSGAARGEGTLGKLIKDDSLYNEARDTLANLNEISSDIKQGKGTLGKLVKDESLYNETKETMANLGQLAKRLNSAEGTFGKLLKDDTLYNQATEAATNLNSILKRIDKGEGTIGKLVTDDSLYYDAKDAVKKVERAIDTQEDLAPLTTIGTAFGILTVF